ncbi:MAG: 16S rRNA (guanine(527)-N(7))-methyltransferase RsmG [Elusimicrobia bacterium]|nr:16S rRNA (guanine(527)-N(7))-methyltransferase RsmG [Elusimicrobiota bacterium]
MEEAFALLREAAAGWGVELTPHKRRLIEDYVGALLAANKTVNLTAETDGEAVLLRHVADGLAAVPVLKKHLAQAHPRICDVGSGGGFIGIAVKIAWPEAEVTLMEALERKFKFLNLAAARTGLKGLRVLRKKAGHDRLASSETGYDAVLARALAPLPEALAACLPLLKEGGIFVDYQSDRVRSDQILLDGVCARLVESQPYRLPAEDKDRTLAVFARK